MGGQYLSWYVFKFRHIEKKAVFAGHGIYNKPVGLFEKDLGDIANFIILRCRIMETLLYDEEVPL